MFLIQLLLPVQPAGGFALEASAFTVTRQELVGAFDGVTAYLRAPAEGVWVAPEGREEHDQVVMVEVVTATFDRQWWRDYAATLAERFGQEVIHIRALPAEMP